MAEVTWDPHRMILNDILLDYCIPCALADWLFVSELIDLSLRDEPIVARNVRGHLGCAHSELIILDGLLGGLKWQVVPWIVSVLADRVTKLCHVIASGGWVCLPVDGPRWSSRGDPLSACHDIGYISIIWNPVACGLRMVYSNSGWGCWKLHHWLRALWSEATLGCLWHIPTDGSAVEELWIVDQLVRNHGVHALSRYLVVSQLHILILIQTDGLETAVVF